MEDDLELKITRKLVYEKSTDELDFVITKKFATASERKKYECIFPSMIDDGEIYLDATMVPIDIIRKMLDQAESKGANFVSIDFHCDHDEYDIYGLKVERASADKIDEARSSEMILNEARKEAEIRKLEEQIRKIKLKKYGSRL